MSAKHRVDHRPFYLWNTPLVERGSRAQGALDLGTARCPKCEKPMTARLGRRGPYFHCGCTLAPVRRNR